MTFSFEVCLSTNVFPPEGWHRNSPKNRKLLQCLDSIVSHRFYEFPHGNLVQLTLHMHVNMPPTCFEGPLGRKILFRDPGLQNTVPGGPHEIDQDQDSAKNLSNPGHKQK